MNLPTKLLTWSPWTHCGMIYAEQGQLPLLFESQKDNTLVDHFTRRRVSGVQCVNFINRWSIYQGDVYACRLNGPSVNNEVLKDLIDEYSGKEFERNPYPLLRSISYFNWLPKLRGRKNLFCSELIVEIYRRLGILRPEKPSDCYSPVDIAPAGRLQYELTPGYSFGPLQLLAKSTLDSF